MYRKSNKDLTRFLITVICAFALTVSSNSCSSGGSDGPNVVTLPPTNTGTNTGSGTGTGTGSGTGTGTIPPSNLTKFTDLGVIHNGEAVNDMVEFNGKLYIATAVDPLGSFGCAITTYDGSTFSVSLSKGSSQGLPRIRIIDGKLYVADGDPNGLTPGFVYISDSSGGNWNTTTVATGAHLFDLIKINDKIYLSGQDGAPGGGALWSSSDGGGSFSVIGPRGNGRHKYFAKYNDIVFLSLESTGHTALSASTMQNVSSPISTSYYAWRWRVINGVLYAGGGSFSDGKGYPLRYDGTEVKVPQGFEYLVWDYCEYGGKIYALAVDGLLESTDNGENFTKIIDAPQVGGQSVFWYLEAVGGGWNQDATAGLAVYNGRLYAGSIQDGHLYLIE
ncbi:MAG: hypothetical protein E3J72_16725 [Planctomycetota bacterium]|nr:MAG: hypothetical protein E3J72_16725 [Planctomycetota bacterium]